MTQTANLENLKEKSKWGGKRPNSGRSKGSKNKNTIEQKKAEEALKQRILTSIDRLFNAQIALAEGVNYLYRIDETEDSKGKKTREHVLVTDPEEIKEVLDDTEGAGGVSGENYYYITTKAPENKAIDSMLDRVFGKARQNIGLDGGEKDKSIKITWE